VSGQQGVPLTGTEPLQQDFRDRRGTVNRSNSAASPERHERLVRGLHGIIRMAVRVLAVLMTFVILMGVVDVVWVLYARMVESPRYVLEISDILATFGTFMAVLIAIEIFVNIVLYLRHDVIHVKLVMATAMMAIARKVIILDFDQQRPEEVAAIAGVVLATSIAYFLVYRYTPPPSPDESHHL
jgi:uncharacterized membrane protein (DUF373 family)